MFVAVFDVLLLHPHAYNLLFLHLCFFFIFIFS